ncbi:hypothetical protein Patl1_31328 [Pistacia atlantica]|uniref:Uncharacterized protein n=1 Tax=Pistacia atlantica TaxID=434234 RepID=A0ACC1ADP2_9ROSI|nr:hypothetical protein Patl1_31328 [Pistacia atlantica]
MEKQGWRCRKLVLVPCPFQGHINPMLQLGTILHSKGFSITVAHAQFNSPQTSNHPDFIFQSLPDGISSKPDIPRDFLAFMSSLNLNCRAPFQEFLSQMIGKQEQQDELPCIIYDALMYFAEAVSSQLKLPSIILQTCSVTTMLTYFAYPRLQEEGYIPPQDSNSTELVPGLHLLRFKDLPSNTFDDLDPTLQLIAILSNIGSSSAIVLCTKLLRRPLVAYWKEDSSCISWLNKQGHNSVIYVSFGSIASVDAKELTEMAWGLANSNQTFLWVIRPDPDNGAEPTDWLPDEFKETVGERGYIVKWAPQQVLAHGAVGGFWSHCGWNSTIESISEGVPMICRPCFGDQKVNTRYISHVWRNGFELENDLERGKIERAIKRLMVEKEGEEMRQKAAELKEKTEVSIKKGGSSNNSLNELVELITSG